MINPALAKTYNQSLVNWAIISGSVFLCLLILPIRLPGLELTGLLPNWLLIWVVAWSVKRTTFQGILAGLVLGLLQDSMTAPDPTHALSLMLVGGLTARLQKQRYIQEDFISVALIVFGMAVLAETVIALQFTWQHIFCGPSCGLRSLKEIWVFHQRVALSSAILSSLWAPVLYFPLNHWWERIKVLEAT